jgi:hypothetical protein
LVGGAGLFIKSAQALFAIAAHAEVVITILYWILKSKAADGFVGLMVYRNVIVLGTTITSHGQFLSEEIILWCTLSAMLSPRAMVAKVLNSAGRRKRRWRRASKVGLRQWRPRGL